MVYLLALRLIKHNSALITQIGNVVLSSNNRVRFFIQVVASAVTRILAISLNLFSYFILLMIFTFDSNANCIYRYDDSFEYIHKYQSTKVLAEKYTGQLVITGNDDAR